MLIVDASMRCSFLCFDPPAAFQNAIIRGLQTFAIQDVLRSGRPRSIQDL
jgi:hypothetical protein